MGNQDWIEYGSAEEGFDSLKNNNIELFIVIYEEESLQKAMLYYDKTNSFSSVIVQELQSQNVTLIKDNIISLLDEFGIKIKHCFL